MKNVIEPQLTNKQKETIIAQALETKEGRKALANAMAEPIEQALETEEGRKALAVLFQMHQLGIDPNKMSDEEFENWKPNQDN